MFCFLHCPVRDNECPGSLLQSNHLLLPMTHLHYTELITKSLHLSWPSHSSSLIPHKHSSRVYTCIATITSPFTLCLLLLNLKTYHYFYILKFLRLRIYVCAVIKRASAWMCVLLLRIVFYVVWQQRVHNYRFLYKRFNTIIFI
jgi:hypothetical protein